MRRVPQLVLILLIVACGEAPPDLVLDEAKLFSAEQEQTLSEFHRYLASDHDIDYRVVTGRGFADINRRAVETFAALDVGRSQTAGRGLLLMIDAEADRVRLEVGYSLEGIFPDAFIAYVEARQMVPFFRAERVADGVLATSELIIDRVQRAKAGGGYEGEVWLPGSGGAGATRQAEIGAGYRRPEARVQTVTGAGRSPAETLKRYLRAMAAHDAQPDLPLYTPETRAMLAGWVMTRAQMDNLVDSYRRCGASTERRDAAGDFAVIRYPIADRHCAPWFFRRVGAEWQLDLAVMQSAIRFGRNNAWRLVPEVRHPYGFAFDDWHFDSSGFPRDRH
jgi:uncharacterized protein